MYDIQYLKHHGIQTLNNNMKLKQLMWKINDDFLEPEKASLTMTITFEHVLTSCRIIVNDKHLTQMESICSTCCNILYTKYRRGQVRYSCFRSRGRGGFGIGVQFLSILVGTIYRIPTEIMNDSEYIVLPDRDIILINRRWANN